MDAWEIVDTNGVMHWRVMDVDKKFFLDRCSERGYTLEETEDCVIKKDGDIWTIDTKHPSYPVENRLEGLYMPAESEQGAGTELKKLLSLVGIKASKQCSCNHYARTMNRFGTQWCRNNTETIIGWLAGEAEKRGMIFSRFIAKRVINMAISRAEKKESK